MDTQAEVCSPYQVLNQFFSIDSIEFPGNSFQKSNSNTKRFNLEREVLVARQLCNLLVVVVVAQLCRIAFA